jgi:hypothetical protein
VADELIVCRPRSLPPHLRLDAARLAVAENPANAVQPEQLAVLPEPVRAVLEPEHIAMLTSKWWGAKGVDLAVQFLDTNDAQLKTRILSHMNAWSETANVRFRETTQQGQVRIARTPNDGYWSYLGTDILSIPAGEPTLNLDSFSLDTPESEYRRVVRHEAGHSLGFPHEHMRAELVAKIDPQKAVAYFAAMDGWDEATVRAQVLTPLEESTLTVAPVDRTSIMCYSLPGSITTDGQPIIGGVDIDPEDAAFAARVYPRVVAPPPPPAAHALTLAAPLPPGTWTLVGPRNAFLYAGRGVPAGTYQLRNDARDE